MIINYSTGAIGVPLEKRIEYLRAMRPDVAALNMGSMNYAKYSRRRKDFVFKAVFENSFDTIIALLENGQRDDGSIALPDVLTAYGAPPELPAAS